MITSNAMTPSLELLTIIGIIAIISVIAIRGRRTLLKRFVLLISTLLLLAIVSASLFTPWTWQWNGNNLQVRIHNIGHERWMGWLLQRAGNLARSA